MHIKKAHIGLFVVILLCIFPLVPWIAMKSLDLRFGSYFSILTSIGQLSALIGTAMFSVSLVLISRLRPLEPYFGGLDRVFQAHRHLGTFGFLLLLIHPLTLAVRMIPLSLMSAGMFLVPTLDDIPKTLGIVALLVMMALLIITFFAVWKYQHLLFAHKFLGIGFMLGVLHGFLIPSDISNSTVLTLYIGALALFGTGAYAYRTLFKGAIPKHYFMVDEVRQLSESVVEIVLEPTGEPLDFLPGQFIFVSFNHTLVTNEPHPFSISSAPGERYLRITVKALGDFTRTLPQLTKGTAVTVEGPFGGFTQERVCKESEVWVAGGIGITPFLSRARALLTTERLGKCIDLYYSAATRKELLFLDELEQIARTVPGFTIIPHPADELSYLNAATLQEHSGPLQDKDIFICGPPPMMNSIIRQCKAFGVRSSQLHREEFSML